MKNTVTAFMVTFIIVSTCTLVFNIQPVESDWTWTETVYILADGSINPAEAPISTVDNVTYTLTDNIIGDISDNGIAIFIEKDDIVFDGAGHTVRGTNASDSKGIVLNGRRNVTITNVEIRLFAYGILLCHSNHTRISANNITENGWGIRLYPNSHHTTITGNNITKQYGDGIRNGEQHTPSNHNIITDNDISENNFGVYVACSSNISVAHNQVSKNKGKGIRVDYSSSDINISDNNMTYNGIPATPGAAICIWNSTDCQVTRNWIKNNNHGLIIDCTSQILITQNSISENEQAVKWVNSSNDTVYHNNFRNNNPQVQVQPPGGSVNNWDNGYPSGGNYWSDYSGEDQYGGLYQNETGSDGIGDTPYVINENNTDSFPLVAPWTPVYSGGGNISKGGETYPVHVTSNATIPSFEETPGSIRLRVVGETGSTGYVRIIQPVGLNATNIKVFVNNTKLTFPSTDPPRSISTNGTHYFIYFTVTFNSTYELLVTFPMGGDVNYDGDVDIFDIVTIAGAYGTTEGQLKYNAHCDIDDDGDIDIFDMVRAAGNYGESW